MRGARESDLEDVFDMDVSVEKGRFDIFVLSQIFAIEEVSISVILKKISCSSHTRYVGEQHK